MNNSEPLRLKELSPLSGKPFCDSLGGSLLGSEMDTKVCPKCGKKKLVTEFNKDRSGKDGLQYQCKACLVRYRIEHRERASAYHKNYRIQNHDRLRDYRIKYREKIKERGRKYAEKYPERRLAKRAVMIEVRAGRLIRPDRCSSPECNEPCKPDAHHWSYLEEHWLDVVWLCRRCHKRIDQSKKEE